MVVVIVMRVIPEEREGHGQFPFITTVLRKATVADADADESSTHHHRALGHNLRRT